MRVVGECFFWYRLTRVFPDKFHRAVKRLCVCVWPQQLDWIEQGLTSHQVKLLQGPLYSGKEDDNQVWEMSG